MFYHDKDLSKGWEHWGGINNKDDIHCFLLFNILLSLQIILKFWSCFCTRGRNEATLSVKDQNEPRITERSKTKIQGTSSVCKMLSRDYT